MTLAQQSHLTADRSAELDLASRQLRAIERFTRAQRAALEASATAARSREMRMDQARTVEVIRREHQALIARADEQLRRSGDLLRDTSRRRVLLAHRNEWFRRVVAEQLEDRGWAVVAMLSNGADAVGVAVAEQPEVLLVEDCMAMVPGVQVVRDVRTFCPQTVVAAQVGYSDRIGALLDAGATTVWTRQVPPREVARGLMELAAA
jgi:CheY-like chemotaxis protein